MNRLLRMLMLGTGVVGMLILFHVSVSAETTRPAMPVAQARKDYRARIEREIRGYIAAGNRALREGRRAVARRQFEPAKRHLQKAKR